MGMAFAGTIALAHTGASGVVLERMNGMTALRDAMRDLTPIVQGVAPYDMETVSQAGDVIAAHSGETMRALFRRLLPIRSQRCGGVRRTIRYNIGARTQRRPQRQLNNRRRLSDARDKR